MTENEIGVIKYQIGYLHETYPYMEEEVAKLYLECLKERINRLQNKGNRTYLMDKLERKLRKCEVIKR